MQVDPIKPKLKAPGTNLLTLKYYEPLSQFAFNFNLRRCMKESRAVLAEDRRMAGAYTRPLLSST